MNRCGRTQRPEIRYRPQVKPAGSFVILSGTGAIGSRIAEHFILPQPCSIRLDKKVDT